MGQPELPDVAKALERRGVYDPDRRRVELNRVPKRVSDSPDATICHLKPPTEKAVRTRRRFCWRGSSPEHNPARGVALMPGRTFTYPCTDDQTSSTLASPPEENTNLL